MTWLRSPAFVPQGERCAVTSCRRYVRNNLLKTDTQRCTMTTVSALMAEHDLKGIDLLKIDVEGAELDVLRGVRPEDWPRIHQARAPAYGHGVCGDGHALVQGAAETQEHQLIMPARCRPGSGLVLQPRMAVAWSSCIHSLVAF